jgi:CheY-like chemotaxis protein
MPRAFPRGQGQSNAIEGALRRHKFMDDQPTTLPSPTSGPAIASELNNLLQIIAGTSALIENIWEGNEGADKYFGMLRESVARAAEVTTGLVELSGSISGKIVMHPEYSRLRHAKTEPAPKGTQKRILVVDDEKMLLILAGELLREAGYAVVTAQSGFECLDLFRASPRRFDLVLLDLSMPLMDGEETFHRLRGLRPDARVMLCTGFVQQERLKSMLNSGLCGFIQKPIGAKEYLVAVRTALTDAAFSVLDSADDMAAAI